MLLDPNGWATDGATALAQWMPSPDGRYLAYAVQNSGSDWRNLYLLDVDTGQRLPDELPWAKFTQIAWDKEGRGFFYSRFPIPPDGAAYQAANRNQALYYHHVGTAQDKDRLVYATPARPDLSHEGLVTGDGRWLVITSRRGLGAGREVHVQSLTQDKAPIRSLVRGLGSQWRFVGSRGNDLYFLTDAKASAVRLVRVNALRPRQRPVVIVAQKAAPLAGASLVGDRFILAYQVDGQIVAEVATLDGDRIIDVPLPGSGAAAGFAGQSGDPETFFSFQGFVTPGSIYRFDTATLTFSLFAQPDLPFDPADYGVEHVVYPSRDGTPIPMTLIRRKSLARAGRAAPTILYGYGGFNISLTPGYLASRMAWVQRGGVYAIANLRGGGEFGKAWHDAGRGANKQNVFDDFIAAGEWLIAHRITPRHGLAAEGRSNGGLLVGAVVNQRPDLFAAALPAVGVMDMLRFDRFTSGRYWTDDYGSPAKADDFRRLYTYSPYHNIRSGVDYPAILVSTGDTDDRVVPAHSFKYAAALQAADLGAKPRLLRVDSRAGHGGGKPLDKLIEEAADNYAFAAYFTGLPLTGPVN